MDCSLFNLLLTQKGDKLFEIIFLLYIHMHCHSVKAFCSYLSSKMMNKLFYGAFLLFNSDFPLDLRYSIQESREY